MNKDRMNPSDFEDMIYDAVIKKRRVSIVDTEGDDYEGIAWIYSSGDDEEDGYSRIILKDGEYLYSFGTNEIVEMKYL